MHQMRGILHHGALTGEAGTTTAETDATGREGLAVGLRVVALAKGKTERKIKHHILRH